MLSLRRHIQLALGLAVLAGAGWLLNFLALTDIYHHEADVRLEWRVVQLGHLALAAFLAVAVAALWRAHRAAR